MKRFFLAVFLMVAALSCIWAGSLVSKKVYMLIDQDLKSGTGFFSSTLGKIFTGDAVKVVEEKGNWIKVETEGKKMAGWVPAASVTTKKVPKKNSRTTASADEIALAGRGWNSDVENTFKGDRKKAYEIIDRMESVDLDSEKLLEFIKDGGLKEGTE